MKLLSLPLIASAAILMSCENGIQKSQVTDIEYGTSFGMCAGYCTQIIEVSEGVISKRLLPQLDKTLTLRECSDPFDGFNALVDKVNINAFMSLEETIGCPDCADGGSEWVEITTPQGSRKVTFEFGKEPQAIQSLVTDLRKEYSGLGECN